MAVKGWEVVYRGERLRADLVAAVLEANGIKVEVFGDTAYSYAINFTDARVLVPEESAESARELIRQADHIITMTGDLIKKLEGEWKVTGGDEHHGKEGKVTYKVTAAGSTLMETQFPGTGHEMVTMYHLDGDELKATHYCAAGNQPRGGQGNPASPSDREAAADR